MTPARMQCPMKKEQEKRRNNFRPFVFGYGMLFDPVGRLSPDFLFPPSPFFGTGGNRMSLESYILVGLGNPGTQYSGTRHNIGFDVIDAVAARNSTEVTSQKWNGLTARISLGGAAVHLLKPVTFMNLSGKSVAKYMDFYKVPPQRLLVVHDDLDMKTGRLKLVCGGGTGGHNGIRSIVASTGSNGFYRLKIGIGRPGSDDVHSRIPIDRYVLTSFAAHETEIIEERMVEIVRGIETFIQGDVSRSMNFLNSFK